MPKYQQDENRIGIKCGMSDLVKRIVIVGLKILRYWFGITNPEQQRKRRRMVCMTQTTDGNAC
ncbi:hypothetical protein [uncultured Algoriphagus sp.]|uniref:hypothetical protein n=1 Tax=uncultured Algoriphagus sp. TaxID=417365 RepID=UPI0030ED226A